MNRQKLLCSIAHIIISVLFGALLYALLQNGRSQLYPFFTKEMQWYVALPCFLMGNPFFKLLRRKNWVITIFFGIIALSNLTLAAYTLAVFLVLIYARNTINNFEQTKKDALAANGAAPRKRFTYTLGAPSRPHTVSSCRSEGIVNTKPLFWINDLMDLAPTPSPSSAFSTDSYVSSTNFYNDDDFDQHHQHFDFGDQHFIWIDSVGHSSVSIPECSFDSNSFNINPGSGLPMIDAGVDVMGNAFGFGSDLSCNIGSDSFSTT